MPVFLLMGKQVIICKLQVKIEFGLINNYSSSPNGL